MEYENRSGGLLMPGNSDESSDCCDAPVNFADGAKCTQCGFYCSYTSVRDLNDSRSHNHDQIVKAFQAYEDLE